MPASGEPLAVKVGPGWVWLAPLGTTEPTDLSTEMDTVDSDWTCLGYTDGGTSFTFDQTFEDVTVDQEYDPIATLQTARQITINVAAAEVTADNLEIAFNGGEVTGPTGGITTFEPPAAGDYTHVMLAWEDIEDGDGDHLERWIFRKCLQIGSVEIARRKAPDKATVPLSFRALKPSGETAFAVLFDSDFVGGS